MTIPRAIRPIKWFARSVGLAPSPLRRPVDRAESLLVAGTVVLALAAMPAAIATGQSAYYGALHTAATQAAPPPAPSSTPRWCRTRRTRPTPPVWWPPARHWPCGP